MYQRIFIVSNLLITLLIFTSFIINALANQH